MSATWALAQQLKRPKESTTRASYSVLPPLQDAPPNTSPPGHPSEITLPSWCHSPSWPYQLDNSDPKYFCSSCLPHLLIEGEALHHDFRYWLLCLILSSVDMIASYVQREYQLFGMLSMQLIGYCKEKLGIYTPWRLVYF